MNEPRWKGFPVRLSVYAVRDEESIRRRTLRERLFSWPWHPLRATQVIHTKVPAALLINIPPSEQSVEHRGYYLIHPAVWAQIKRFEGESKRFEHESKARQLK